MKPRRRWGYRAAPSPMSGVWRERGFARSSAARFPSSPKIKCTFFHAAPRDGLTKYSSAEFSPPSRKRGGRIMTVSFDRTGYRPDVFHAQVKQMFFAVCDLDRRIQRTRLQEMCGDQPKLLRAVNRLLDHDVDHEL